MGMYEIPRNTKGEGRILYVFSTKALIYTVAGILIGIVFRWLLNLIGSVATFAAGVLNGIGIAFIILFALIKEPLLIKLSIERLESYNITKSSSRDTSSLYIILLIEELSLISDPALRIEPSTRVVVFSIYK